VVHPGLEAEHGLPWKTQFWLLAQRYGLAFAKAEEDAGAYRNQFTMYVNTKLADLKTPTDNSRTALLRAAYEQERMMDVDKIVLAVEEDYLYAVTVSKTSVTTAQAKYAFSIQVSQFTELRIKGEAYRWDQIVQWQSRYIQQQMKENLSFTGQLRALGSNVASWGSSAGAFAGRWGSALGRSFLSYVPGYNEIMLAGGGSFAAGASFLGTTWVPYQLGVLSRGLFNLGGSLLASGEWFLASLVARAPALGSAGVTGASILAAVGSVALAGTEIYSAYA